MNKVRRPRRSEVVQVSRLRRTESMIPLDQADAELRFVLAVGFIAGVGLTIAVPVLIGLLLI